MGQVKMALVKMERVKMAKERMVHVNMRQGNNDTGKNSRRELAWYLHRGSLKYSATKGEKICKHLDRVSLCDKGKLAEFSDLRKRTAFFSQYSVQWDCSVCCIF